MPTAPRSSDDQFVLDLRRVVLPLVATGSDLSFEPVGTVFIIHARERLAIALTAAHNLNYIARLNSPYPLHHETTLPEFRIRVSDIDLDNFKGSILYPDPSGKAHSVRLARAYALEPSDIAVCILEIPENLPPEVAFGYRIAIDTSLPREGTRIAAIGYSNMEVSDRTIHNRTAQVRLDLRLNRREGFVSKVFPSYGPRGQSYPCFQCNIPFDHGMSGGPIMDLSDERAVAIGVISSDMSFENAISGSGQYALASVLWPAMATRMKWEQLYGRRDPYLLEFEKAGLIEDRGKASQHVQIVEGATPGELIMNWSE